VLGEYQENFNVILLNTEVAKHRKTTKNNGPYDPLKSMVGNDFIILGFRDSNHFNTPISWRAKLRSQIRWSQIFLLISDLQSLRSSRLRDFLNHCTAVLLERQTIEYTHEKQSMTHTSPLSENHDPLWNSELQEF
jgi:hypothetical protein